MRILFDQGVPNPLRHSLSAHEVTTAYEQGWSLLKNGELLKMAEEGGYELFVTTDTNLKHQQNLTSQRLGIVVLLSTSWPRMQRVLPSIAAAIESATVGTYTRDRNT